MKLDKVIDDYLWEMDHGNASKYILDNLASIRAAGGRQLVREMILNYKINKADDYNHKSLLAKFYSHVASKKNHHTSDLAMAYSLINKLNLNKHDYENLMMFMYQRIKNDTPLLRVAEKAGYKVICSLTMDHVHKMLEERKDGRYD